MKGLLVFAEHCETVTGFPTMFNVTGMGLSTFFATPDTTSGMFSADIRLLVFVPVDEPMSERVKATFQVETPEGEKLPIQDGSSCTFRTRAIGHVNIQDNKIRVHVPKPGDYDVALLINEKVVDRRRVTIEMLP